MGTKPYEFSVVLCTHNGTQYLEQQLVSIFGQTYLPTEVIISDDNSTDGTIEFSQAVIRNIQQQKPALKKVVVEYISNVPALGVTKNFENAIRKAKCELIALSDQDDIWELERLSSIVDVFAEDPELVLFHSDALLVDGDNYSLNCTLFEALRVSNSEKELINSGRGNQVLLRRNIVTGATTVFRKSLVKDSLPFPTEFLHDEWLALVATFTGKLKLSETPLIRYRQHGNNQVGVRKLGLKHAVGRIIFPRTERNTILLNRSVALSSHPFFALNPDDEIRNIAAEKLAHERVRSSYPSSRIRRVRPVLKELKTGRYSDFGLGFQDILRDLIQPV